MLTLKPRDFCLQDAARLLGTTRPKLVHALIERGLLTRNASECIVPTPAHMHTGMFRVEPRLTYTTAGIRRHYYVTHVSLQGLAAIETLLRQPSEERRHAAA